SGIIATTSDTDSFTINVDAGQTISVVVAPSASLQPTLTLTAPGGGITTAPVPAVGKKALLQTIASGTGGIYTVKLGSASGTGAYTVQVLLNAALEAESNDGASNNTTPQDINGSFITVQTSTTSAQRGAVLGQTDGFSYSAAAIGTTFESVTSKSTKVLAGANDGTPPASELAFPSPSFSSA